ncbi:hypothetical protein QR680_016985 [Steinernema hermaphroditum]|uniref:eRF1/Pelota-like N-terminal domain-containing protein n=1 Tax=Steinernema hermaphroditum TaxID=289476 RepID=A0AA39HE23_9BILA|nr:hypothetical protein QR680_016985 [Steinernema hermaphroditum]
MKLISRDISGDRPGNGFVEMTCENVDDLANMYNIIRAGDVVTSFSQRRITKYYRAHCEFVISVTEVTCFDELTGELTIKGTICEANKYCHTGLCQTIILGKNQKFKLYKELWDTLDLRRLNECFGVNRPPDVAVIVAHAGIANLCLISSSVTLWKTPIRYYVPHKRKDHAAVHEIRMEKFLLKIAEHFIKHVDMKTVKRVIIAAGFVLREKIYRALITAGERRANNVVAEQNWKIMLTRASSGFPHALAEVLSNKIVKAALDGCKFQSEFDVINEFYEMMRVNEYRAVYGWTHTLFAAEMGCIGTLLISDALIRSWDPENRLKNVKIIEDIEHSGGRVHIISSMHVGGKQLSLIHNIAAILYREAPEIDDIPLSDDEAVDG